MKRRGTILSFAFLSAATITTPVRAAPVDAPTLRQIDSRPLGRLIQFAPSYQSAGDRFTPEIYWALQIDLPKGTKLDRVDMLGYSPVILHLNDGRCFMIGLNSSGNHLNGTSVAEQPCERFRARFDEPRTTPPGKRLRYVSKVWTMDAWYDPRRKRAVIYSRARPDKPTTPVLFASMKLLGAGGIGGPDTPQVEMSLIGMARGRLILVTVDVPE